MNGHHHNVEQVFDKFVVKYRLQHDVQVVRCGPSHDATFMVSIVAKRKDLDQDLQVSASAGKKKDALKTAMQLFLHKAAHIPDPCNRTFNFEHLWDTLKKPICAFKTPPREWFESGQVLGIDWEGSPVNYTVQIAGIHGVLVADALDPVAIDILRDRKHVHCVFGEHEVNLVARPDNLQFSNKVSLAEVASRVLAPQVRFFKQTTDLHAANVWRQRPLPTRALRYAALDAEITRMIGVEKRSGRKKEPYLA
jgi:hypothetical protein